MVGPFLFLLVLLIPLFSLSPAVAEMEILQKRGLTVLFDQSSSTVAREIAATYPSVMLQVKEKLGSNITLRTCTIVVKGKVGFRQFAGSGLINAYAIPERNLIVMDASKIYLKPFSLETTLSHELCHLVLHENAAGKDLPRWFNEGVCQWMSGGIAEFLIEGGDNLVAEAVVSGTLRSMHELVVFPSEDDGLLLAYAESRGFVQYLVDTYGSSVIPRIISSVSEGTSFDESFSEVLSDDLRHVEAKWRLHLSKSHTWISYFSGNLSLFLFFFAAVLTIVAFVGLMKKKRAYRDEEEAAEGGEELTD